MVTRQQLDGWKRGLRSTFPVVGAMRRRSAMVELVNNRNEAKVIPLLAEVALGKIVPLSDTDNVDRARQALATLEAKGAVNALCAAWVKEGEERLGEIIAKCGYVASAPPLVRVLSGLKAGAVDSFVEADAELTRMLIDATKDRDPAVSENARAALKKMGNQKGIDALCVEWAKGRDDHLGAIIAECGYVATEPADVRILSALKSGERIPVDRAEEVRSLVGVLHDADEALRAGAEKFLRESSPGPAVGALCDEGIRNPAGPVSKLCIEAGFRPSDRKRLCLFLFVTRQLDAYFEEDSRFENLRIEYDRASAEVQGHVIDVIRSGDVRCAEFFGSKSNPLAQCSEEEIKAAMDCWLGHQDWPRVFDACLELPLRHSVAAFVALRDSGWEPEAEDLRLAYRQILADSDGLDQCEAKQSAAVGPLFEQWLVEAWDDELARLSKAELLSRLETALPPEGIAIVTALATKTHPGSEAAELVRSNPHWPIRLAGYASGLLQEHLTHDEIQDSNHWISELASTDGIWGYWPGRATLEDLEVLAAATDEAFSGELGAARKILRRIIEYRISAGMNDPANTLDWLLHKSKRLREFKDSSAHHDAGQSKEFRESDNLGTRHDTYRDASQFWHVNMHTDVGPHLVYVFANEADARQAMLEVGCFHEAVDTGKLICTEVLTYGCYEAPDGTWEAEVLGKDLSPDLWAAAKDVFEKHGGRLKYNTDAVKSEQQPDSQQGETITATPPKSTITFVEEVKQVSEVNGQEMTYRIHTGPNAEAAKAFLKDHPVTHRLFYIVVETPEGTYGRDIDGIYQQ